MKQIILLFGCLTFFVICAKAQTNNDGSPEMSYNSNNTTYSNSYYSNNTNSRYQSGYTRSNGTYVEPTYKTNPNNTNLDNYSTQGNTNPYSGNTGYRAKDYSSDANNYGSGQIIYTGSRGGEYYYNSNGNKVYVPKR